MVVDAIVNGRDYESFEQELIADWRIHYAGACAKLKTGPCRRCIASSSAIGRKTRMPPWNWSNWRAAWLRLDEHPALK